uniref:Cysteine-rich motor neuron 1 protein n=2 Tax=Timema TaxID=61471 RepID=A0A7R8VI72_TIMDO|nr:unnamed protein product [Timema douglasi]
MKPLRFNIRFSRHPSTNCTSNHQSGVSGPCEPPELDEAPCPPDSVLNDEEECVCARGRCLEPVCRYGSKRVLQRTGSGVPGDCCDVFECVLPRAAHQTLSVKLLNYIFFPLLYLTLEKDCEDVVCPEEGRECPLDSYRLPSHRAPGDCCSVPQGCQCLPAPCPVANCSPGSYARVVRPGSEKPGTCCPLFECVPIDTNNNASCLIDDKLETNGSTWWKDECTSCTCDEGQIYCTITPQCPELPPTCTVTRIPPKQCCPVCVCKFATRSVVRPLYPSCLLFECHDSHYNFTCYSLQRPNGLRHHSHVNPGRSRFESRSGLLRPPCKPFNSCWLSMFDDLIGVPVDGAADNTPTHPDGCITSGGKMLQNGHSWHEDPCTPCVCQGGHKKCQAYMCEVSCVNPTYVPDDCCPLCDSTSVILFPPHCPTLNNCSLRCVHGFVRNDAGCFMCQCQAEECLLECPDGGYLQDTHGNKLCECAEKALPPFLDCPPLVDCHKNCSHGFRVNKAGCPVCKCSQCRTTGDCHKNCIHGLRTNDRGCTICKCRATPDPSGEFVSPTHIITGTTCISPDGQVHDEGETWFDGCRQCYCHGGTEMCILINCPVPDCDNPIYNSTIDCCPHCRGPEMHPTLETPHPMVCQSVDGMYRVEGETWQLDRCTKCLCHSGRVLCETRQCPPTPCDQPVQDPDNCCPHCPEGEFPAIDTQETKSCGMQHPDGATWRDGACNSCVCKAGKTKCFTETCPLVSCDRPVLIKNHCCSVCLGNVTYQHEEQWSQDLCTHCVCIAGVRTCTEKVCSVACSNPVKKLGRCCPVCPGKLIMHVAISIVPPTLWSISNHGLISLMELLIIYRIIFGRRYRKESSYTGNNHETSLHSSNLSVFRETLYIIGMSVMFLIICFLVYILWQHRRRRQHLTFDGSPKSGPSPAYKGYTHHDDSFPPPHYSTADRGSKMYQYDYVPSYDPQHITDMLKSPSIEATEKSAIARV